MSSSNRAVQKLVKLANRGEKYDVWAMRSQDYCDIGFVGTLWYAVSRAIYLPRVLPSPFTSWGQSNGAPERLWGLMGRTHGVSVVTHG